MYYLWKDLEPMHFYLKNIIKGAELTEQSKGNIQVLSVDDFDKIYKKLNGGLKWLHLNYLNAQF